MDLRKEGLRKEDLRKENLRKEGPRKEAGAKTSWVRHSVSDSAKPMGRVILVGAGPGDPDLITVRGAAVLAEADVVVYDALAETALP